MNKKLLFILTGLAVLILPNVAFGATATIADIVNNIRLALNAALFGIVVISWIVVAGLFLTAVGSPERYGLAKKALMWTITGTAIYALGNLVITIIKEAVRG